MPWTAHWGRRLCPTHRSASGVTRGRAAGGPCCCSTPRTAVWAGPWWRRAVPPRPSIVLAPANQACTGRVTTDPGPGSSCRSTTGWPRGEWHSRLTLSYARLVQGWVTWPTDTELRHYCPTAVHCNIVRKHKPKTWSCSSVNTTQKDVVLSQEFTLNNANNSCICYSWVVTSS